MDSVQFVSCRQERAGVGADLDELYWLVDVGLGRLQCPFGDDQVEQAVRDLLRGSGAEVLQVAADRVGGFLA